MRRERQTGRQTYRKQTDRQINQFDRQTKIEREREIKKTIEEKEKHDE